MKYFQPITLAFIGGFLLYLYLTDHLTYFIHPDYFLFTAIMGTTLLVFGMGHLVHVARENQHSPADKPVFQVVGFLLLIIIFCFGYIIPKKSLSPQTAENRGLSSNQQNFIASSKNDENLKETVSLFGKVDTKIYSITDWVTLLSVNPEPLQYVGKNVVVKGFVTNSTDKTFLVSRFVVTCCAVDAVTVSLQAYQLAKKPVTIDDWVIVHGTFSVLEEDGNRTLIITPEKVEYIDEPDNPYFY